MSEPFTIRHEKDFEKNGKWSLVRRSLDLNAFGMNMATLQPGETIVEHDETERNQEEVFIILNGTATMIINGEEHEAPEGTYIRVSPEPKRNLANNGTTPVKILIVSAPCSSGYVPMEWA